MRFDEGQAYIECQGNAPVLYYIICDGVSVVVFSQLLFMDSTAADCHRCGSVCVSFMEKKRRNPRADGTAGWLCGAGKGVSIFDYRLE